MPDANLDPQAALVFFGCLCLLSFAPPPEVHSSLPASALVWIALWNVSSVRCIKWTSSIASSCIGHTGIAAVMYERLDRIGVAYKFFPGFLFLLPDSGMGRCCLLQLQRLAQRNSNPYGFDSYNITIFIGGLAQKKIILLSFLWVHPPPPRIFNLDPACFFPERCVWENWLLTNDFNRYSQLVYLLLSMWWSQLNNDWVQNGNMLFLL